MQPKLFLSKAMAITIWSCLGMAMFVAFPSRTHEAWLVALVVLAGQALILGLPTFGRRAPR